MNRVIVDFKKLTDKILNLLVEKYPDGYNDSDIITFKNASGEIIEAVEVRTEDTDYLVKVSVKLAESMVSFMDDDEDDDDDTDVIVAPDVKEIDFGDVSEEDEPEDDFDEHSFDDDEHEDDEAEEKEDWFVKSIMVFWMFLYCSLNVHMIGHTNWEKIIFKGEK